jgi:hypothetical protein
MKARNSTLQILIEAILNAAEDDVPAIVRKIRTCDSLDLVAEQILNQDTQADESLPEEPPEVDYDLDQTPVEGERDLARKMGELRLENGSLRFIGGTSHLIYLGDPAHDAGVEAGPDDSYLTDDPATSWTRVTQDPGLILHLLNMYFSYHYPYFTTLSKKLFWRDYLKGKAGLGGQTTVHCSPLLVNAMLALGCHFTDLPGAFGTLGDTRTKGDHFFAEAKRLIIEHDEYEKPRLVTVQALALMSVREAGCAREAKGWVYSGMAFRMAYDIGLNFELEGIDKERMEDDDIDARRITFWGCFLFDKCWSNYLGRLPQITKNSFNVASIDVFPDEDAALWSPLTDDGFDDSSKQPSRTRAVSLQLSKICEISSDLLVFFYHPNHIGRSSGKAVELKKLSELHQRLEEWRHQVPKELEPKDGQLPNVILMHMFFHLQYIHLFRPFLKYAPSTSPLPAHVSPRRICTANAGAISKLMRLYKKTWNLRQICNIAVYMVHSACTIHLLNLPEKTAKRDITHGIKHLEEIAEDWPCARRTLSILSVLARKWKCELPEDAAFALERADERYGSYNTSDVPSPRSNSAASPGMSDGAALSKIRKAYSPLNPFTTPHVSQENQPIPMDDDMLMEQSVPDANRLAQNRSINSDTARLRFDVETASNWNQATMMAPPMQFQPGYSSSRNSAKSPPVSRRTQPTLRSASASLGMNMDSQDWFFSDSARWQQSFESWDTSTVQQSSGLFVFGDKQPLDVPGVQGEEDEQLPDFEDLGSLGGGGTGWLHGLD